MSQKGKMHKVPLAAKPFSGAAPHRQRPSPDSESPSSPTKGVPDPKLSPHNRFIS